MVCVFAWLGPVLWRADPAALDPLYALSPPSARHFLGTDELGRDLLARLMAGGATTLGVAVPATAFAVLLGVLYGFLAGLGPAWLDRGLMRLLDAILALPTLVVLIALTPLLTMNDATLVALIGAASWPGLARLVRNEALAQKDRDFVLAAQQMGGSAAYVGRVHVARVMAPLLVVNATLLLGDSILTLSALSFLGLGVQPPQTSWGQLLQSGLSLIDLSPWWLILPPGGLIVAVLLAISLIGSHAVLDPRH